MLQCQKRRQNAQRRWLEGAKLENKDYEKLRNKILEADMDSCRMVLHVDLLQDYCTAMKSSSDGWQPEENSLSGQLEQLI